MRALLAGRLDRRGYGLLLRSLHEIYAALERPLAPAGTRAWPPCATPRWRAARRWQTTSLALHGPDWRDELAAQPGRARRTRAHLAELDRQRARLLLAAHAYVRYLGDLSGGQLLRARWSRARSACATATPGTRFYDFDARRGRGAGAAPSAAALDRLAPDAPLREAIVDEAGAAFEPPRAPVRRTRGRRADARAQRSAGR